MRHILKNIIAAIIITGFMTLWASQGLAIPTLQLDIENGYYDSTTQTIVSSGSSFNLYAYLIPNWKNLLSDTYYISMAVSPKIDQPGATLGSFSFNGTDINVTSDMTYGVPPLEDIVALQGWDSGDLPPHCIYPTYFYEFEFSFNSGDYINPYNTQDRAIDGYPTYESGKMYY